MPYQLRLSQLEELLNTGFSPVTLEWQSVANPQPLTKIECGIDSNTL